MADPIKIGRISVLPCGKYDPERAYQVLDLVSFQGGGFVARRDLFGVEPAPGEDWQQIAERGAAGAAGEGNAKWHAGTEVSGQGSGISTYVPDSNAGDMYINSATSDLYSASAPDTWDWVMRLADTVAVDASDVLVGVDGDTVESILEEFQASIVDLEARAAEDIPTNEAGVSMQDALDFQSEAIQALKGQTAIEILATTLLQDAWTQDENSGIFEQSISNILFAAANYSYHMAVAPADIFAAADLGGIIMASVADGSAIFQCRSQPEADIAIQIERTPRKEDA